MSNRRLSYPPHGAFDQRFKGERRNEITIWYEESAFCRLSRDPYHPRVDSTQTCLI